jgi:ABC-type transport system involved in multi-copper enzyme maturation permease subunit
VRKLLWKEWHEQSWKLGFGCLVLSALAWIGLRSRIISDEQMVNDVCFFGFTLLPILSSAGLVPAERSEGSFESLLAMPVSPWKILAAKTLIGMLLCAGPLVAATIVSVLATEGREAPIDGMLASYGATILAGLSLFVWMMTLTIRLPSEARAALVALGVLIMWWIVSVATIEGNSEFRRFLSAFSPLLLSYPWLFGLRELPQVLILCLLWIWAGTQLAKSVEGPQ